MKKVSPNVRTSAKVIVNHIPYIPNSQDSRNIPMTRNTSARPAEMIAEITPFPYAVKNPEANILTPPRSTAKPSHLTPVTAIS